MPTNYGSILNPTETPQSKPAREDQVQNSAGGYTFPLDKWNMLDRFLIIGVEGNTYYTEQKQLVETNAKNVIACIKEDGQRVVRRVVEISDAGRAPRNDSAIFVLALCQKHGNDEVKTSAYSVVPSVCRTFDHLATLINTRKALGMGEGHGIRRAVANWYTEMSTDRLAYQMAKYPNRQGYSHHDMMHLGHPQSSDPVFNALALYAKTGNTDGLPAIIRAREQAMLFKDDPVAVAGLVRGARLTHEMVPNEVKNDPNVWEAMLESMPMTATIRNLGKMSSIGLLGPLAANNSVVVQRLTNAEQVRRSRLHPLTVLQALVTYRSGAGMLGDLTWTPAQPILDALEEAFFLSFGNVKPTGKRILLALDVSGSMGSPIVPPRQFGRVRNQRALLSVREAAACLAMVVARTEANYHIVGFCEKMVDLPITAKTSLAEAVNITNRSDFGGTDCALPFMYALGYNANNHYSRFAYGTSVTPGKYKKTGGRQLGVDAFITITDNETWAGEIHPYQALTKYREETGIPAYSVVWGMTSTGFTIADPNDARSMDVVGFDTAAPNVISDFIGGE